MPHGNLFNSVSTSFTPMPTFCRHCGSSMATLHRPLSTQTNGAGYTRVIPASTAITCKNVHCQLNGFTFEAKTYRTEDLSIYGVKVGVR